MNDITPAALAPTVVWCTFGLAFVFGLAAQRSNFCTMGAVSDIVNMDDWTRMRMWPPQSRLRYWVPTRCTWPV